MNKTILMLSALTLGTAALGSAAHADNSMARMNMGGKAAVQKPSAPASAALSATAVINPAAPQAGDNTLDLTITGPDGKPAAGLKLTTTVTMRSMDMGTTHPAVTDQGGGHYTARVNFGMDGPWRVVVRSQSRQVAVLDFNAGSKAPWKSPQTRVAPSQPADPSANAMPGMDMSGGRATAGKTDSVETAPSGSRMGMNMSGTPDTDAAGTQMTGIADMKTATVPQLQETGTYTATGDEDWKMQTGFGHNAPMVAMMNQMMVGGSGGEGMKMAPMTMKFDKQNFAKPDANSGGDSMAGMDMGGGNKATQDSSMAGMKRDAPKERDAPKAGDTPASAPVKITATTASAPKAGDNPLTISVADAQGRPVTGAAISTSVAMTSMDMGTAHPAVTEKGAGQYTATVTFGMAGPWRVQVQVTPPGRKPQTKAFDFTAK